MGSLVKSLAYAATFVVLSMSVSSVKARSEQPNDQWERRAWLDKAARTLRMGQGLSSDDSIDALLSMPDADIVNAFMSDRRFIDTTLDFSLFFLGFKPAHLYRQNTGIPHGKDYDPAVFDIPQALSAARALAGEGDFFTLFSEHQPMYLQAFRTPAPLDPQSNQLHVRTERDIRLVHLNAATSAHESLTAFFQPDPDRPRSITDLCRFFEEKYGQIFANIFKSGIPEPLGSSFLNNYLSLQIACITGDESLDRQSAFVSLSKLRDNFAKLLLIVDHPSADGPIISGPEDIAAIDPSRYGISSSQSLLSPRMWIALPNSSTNGNRRRAAYVLKTYFCDDLTPINIALPDTHTGNRHGTQPACAACHYKLDPMAGFFRSRGIAGIDFNEQNIHVFDDLAILRGQSLADYHATWRNSVGQSPEWNIGFIRSPTLLNLNSYGTTFQDLFSTIRQAKEVKLCLTRRLTEYFLGTNQSIDGGWIDHLAQRFQQVSEGGTFQGSNAAFKSVVKDLILSRTFRNTNPDLGTCYDFPPNHADTSLPCEVAYVLNKNCVSCHRAEGAAGNLDLTTWRPLENGIFNFNHWTSDHQPIPRAETFARMAERLSTFDEDRLMPLHQHMDALERTRLYTWIQQQTDRR